MPQISTNRARPVNIRLTRPPCALRPVERASKSLARVVFEPAHKIVHDFANHLPCGFKRFARNSGT